MAAASEIPGAGPALAKITWGQGDKVTNERLADFIAAARERKVRYCFWTFETTFLEGLYDLDALCRALGLDPARIRPLAARLGAKK